MIVYREGGDRVGERGVKEILENPLVRSESARAYLVNELLRDPNGASTCDHG
jgi:hypothetical protein